MPSSIPSRPPSPNRGSGIAADLAVENQETLEQWRKEMGIDVSKQVRLVKLSHMRYQHKDMEKIAVFMHDFGMRIVKKTDEKIWFGGYGEDHYVYVVERGTEDKFLGGVYLVESEADLEKASQISGASAIEDLNDAPGRGRLVTVLDPEGFPVNLIFGQDPVPASQLHIPEKLVYNFEDEKKRINKFQRFKEGPAAVHKLGHYGLCVRDFVTQWKFYVNNFNLVPTDWLYIDEPDGNKRDVALFAHIDRGEDYVDHHTFFLSTNKSSHVHHCSFEVHDFDTQLLGHKWLAKRGYKSVWGVGRHILGSQIFDYWWDTSGFMIEHYADGDQINHKTPIGRGPAGDESLAVWGPEVPATFLD
ncbi:trihydroxytoluene oxygenase protein [Rutstroemia sp. NJR-2017a BVV2]|nr:trihydroxytoluene oxygenase protein [Rutstroemia sp. NJR-2017a BVV2]